MGENIIIFCAHNDDQVIGCGGTIAKYSKEGKKVMTIIFSYGELSHPHLQRKVVVKTRVKESLKAEKILGGSGIIYLGLDEGKFAQQIKDKKVDKRLKSMIKEKKPAKIFTHSSDDPHPDHRAVNSIITKILEEMNYKDELYSFDIWNFLQTKKRNTPKLIVDISNTFKKKVEAFKANKSQQITIFTLMGSVYLKAIINGWNNNYKYAEVFRKLR